MAEQKNTGVDKAETVAEAAVEQAPENPSNGISNSAELERLAMAASQLLEPRKPTPPQTDQPVKTDMQVPADQEPTNANPVEPTPPRFIHGRAPFIPRRHDWPRH